MSLQRIFRLFPLNFLHSYFLRSEKYSTPRFIFELTIFCFILKILSILFFGIIFSVFSYNPSQDLSLEQEMVNNGWFYILLTVPLFAAFETLTGQWLIIWLVSKFSKSKFLMILISSIVFALLHIEPIIMVAVWPVGIVLAWAFILYRRKSRWSAFWVTTAIHAFHNYIALYLVWVSIR